MKSLKIISAFSVLLFFTWSCQSTDPYAAYAGESCVCMKSMSDLFNEVQSLSDNSKTEDLQAMMASLESAAEEAEKCSDNLSDKYPEVTDDAKIEEALKKACPEVLQTVLELEEGLE